MENDTKINIVLSDVFGENLYYKAAKWLQKEGVTVEELQTWMKNHPTINLPCYLPNVVDALIDLSKDVIAQDT